MAVTSVSGAEGRELANATIGLGNTHAIEVKCSSCGIAGTDSEVGFMETVTAVDDSVDFVPAVVDSTL